MRTPASGRPHNRADTTSTATSMRRPTMASRSYVLAFGCRRSTLTPPSSPARPALKTTPNTSGASGAEEPPHRQTHRLTTHYSFRDAGHRLAEPGQRPNGLPRHSIAQDVRRYSVTSVRASVRRRRSTRASSSINSCRTQCHGVANQSTYPVRIVLIVRLRPHDVTTHFK
jgi:hypothetical protein